MEKELYRDYLNKKYLIKKYIQLEDQALIRKSWWFITINLSVCIALNAGFGS